MPSSQTWYRLHASSPEAEVSTYSTEFDGSQDFSNTLYEVGICHALQKPVLLVDRRVPFDLRHRRVLLYD
jgi:hypothetical protein